MHRNRLEPKASKIAVGLLLILGLIPACGKQEPVGLTDAEQSPGKRPPAAADAGAELVGIWLAEAFLDETALEQKLRQKSPTDQTQLMQEARNFATIVVAMDFRADGRLEHEVEMRPEGQGVVRQAGYGTWRVVGTTGDALTVEITEKLADGTELKTTNRCEVDRQGNRFVMRIPVSQDLLDCRAALVFQRQFLDDGHVAKNPGGPLQK